MTKKQWCSCCTNEETIAAAERIAEFAVHEYYKLAGKGPMCIGSVQISTYLAGACLGYISAHAADNVGLPNEVTAALQSQLEDNVVLSFIEHHEPRDVIERIMRRIDASVEIAEADKAFAERKPG